MSSEKPNLDLSLDHSSGARSFPRPSGRPLLHIRPSVTLKVLPLAAPKKSTKMRVTDLPVELIEKILLQTIPHDFEAFALCCKTVYRVAEHRLISTHFDRKLEWSRLVPAYEDQDFELFTPFHTCYAIMKNPTISMYAETLVLPDMTDCTAVSCSQVVELGKSPGFKEFVLEHPFWSLKPALAETKEDAFESVRPYCNLSECSVMSFPCAFLIMLLPNLKEVFFRDTLTTGWDIFADFIEAAYSKPCPPGFLRPFQNITHLVVEVDDSHIYDEEHGDMWQTLDCVQPMLLLPSLKLFRTGWLGPDNVDIKSWKWKYGKTVSTVEEFDASYNYVDHHAMAEFLRPMTSLRRLYWVHWGDMALYHESSPWDATAFINAVAKVAGGRLEAFSFCLAPEDPELDLNYNVGFISGYVKSFESFKQLKYLEFPLDLLRHPQECESNLDGDDCSIGQPFHGNPDEIEFYVPRLVDILPKTVEEVRLNMDTVCAIERKKLFEGLVDGKEMKLPNLRTITLSHPKPHADFENINVRLLRKKLDRVGVELGLEGHINPHLHYLGRDDKTRSFLRNVGDMNDHCY